MINRKPEIEEFHTFLKPQSPDWLLIAHGQNGIGKTTLLENLAADIETSYTVACLDFSRISSMQWSSRTVLEELNQALLGCGLPESKWQKYHQEQAVLDRWSAEKKIDISQSNEAHYSSRIENTQQKVIVHLAAELQKFEDEANLKRVSSWLDLASELKSRLVIFVDHWDLLALKGEPVFRRWFLESLLRKASQRLPGFRAVLASDRPFIESGFETGVRMIELRPLDRPDALILLEQEGVDRSELRDSLFQRLDGNPLLLKLAGTLYRKNPGINLSDLNRNLDVQAAVQWLIGRIHSNFPDDDSKKALSRGVILDYFNLEMMQSICENPKMDGDWFEDFSTNPFLVDSLSQTGCKEFVRTVREIQISRLWTQEKREFKRLHGIALNWYHS
jgi:hypothetical protein